MSIPHRLNSPGEKRNACAALASPDVEGFLIADDDDIHLSHWFRTQAKALQKADWSQSSLVLLEHQEGLREAETGGLYHRGWAFRKAALQKVRGYGPHNNGEDQELADRLRASGATISDPSGFAGPFYLYRYENESYHLSYMDDSGCRRLRQDSFPSRTSISVGWKRQWDKPQLWDANAPGSENTWKVTIPFSRMLLVPRSHDSWILARYPFFVKSSTRKTRISNPKKKSENVNFVANIFHFVSALPL